MEIYIIAYCAYIVVGAIAGIMAGLLGVGGGVVAVPCLFLIFHLLKFPQAYIMHMAIGTSLAAMMFNTLSATRAHNQRKAVMWWLLKKIAPGLVFGGLIGSVIADYVSDVILQILFGIFLCVIGIMFFRRTKPHLKEHNIPKNPLLSLIFSGIGALSVVLGLGGGIFTVPTLLAFKVPQKTAIGTSSAITFLMTIIGSVAFLYLGLEKVEMSDSLGYINIPAFLIIGISSFFVAPYGVKMAHELPEQIVKRVFGIVMILTGISMLA